MVNQPPAAASIQPELDVPTETYFSWQITFTGGQLSSAMLSSHLDESLAFTGQVDIDGAAAPAASVSTSGRDVSVDLAAYLTTPRPFTLTVTFAALVVPRSAVAFSSYLDVSFDNAAHEGPAVARSAAVLQHALVPDLALSVGLTQLIIARGGVRDIPFTVINRAAPVTAALADILTVELPPNLSVLSVQSAPEPGSSFACHRVAAQRWTCGLPHPGVRDTGVVRVQSSPASAAPAAGSLRLVVEPSYGFPDLAQADNSVVLPVMVTLPAAPQTPSTPAAGPAPLPGTGVRAAPALLAAALVIAAGSALVLVARGRRGRW